MKIKISVGFASAAVLAIAGWTNAVAAPLEVTTQCKLTDVTIEDLSALACAGAFDGVDGTSGNQINPNDFVAGDWSAGIGPNPLKGWLFGSKYNVGTGYELGVLGAGSIVAPEDDDLGKSGTFVIDISPYAEVILAFKQSTDVAFYYFKNGGEGSYILTWDPSGGPSGSDGDVFSHLSLFVRGERHDVPEPATLALLGVGLIGFGIARRRRSA